MSTPIALMMQATALLWLLQRKPSKPLVAASAGDLIIVSVGTYSENVNVTKPLTILGAGKGSNPTSSTILSPTTACTGIGITVAAANVTPW